MKAFEIVEHTADIGITAYGKNLQELFTNAGLGTASLIVDPDTVSHQMSHAIVLRALDREELLIAFLNEIIFYYSARQFLTGRVELSLLEDTYLKAELSGQRYDALVHHIRHDIKSATYHMIQIREPEHKKGLWSVRVIFDV